MGSATLACSPSGPQTPNDEAASFDVDAYSGAELALGLRSGMSVEEAQATLKKQGIVTVPSKPTDKDLLAAGYTKLEWERAWQGDPGPADLRKVHASFRAAGLADLTVTYSPSAERYSEWTGKGGQVCYESDENVTMRPSDVLQMYVSRDGTGVGFVDNAIHRKSDIAGGQGKDDGLWLSALNEAAACKKPATYPEPVLVKGPSDVLGTWVIKPNAEWKADHERFTAKNHSRGGIASEALSKVLGGDAAAAKANSDDFQAWLNAEERVIEVHPDKVVFPVRFGGASDDLAMKVFERRYRYSSFEENRVYLEMETKEGDPDGGKGAKVGTTRVSFNWSKEGSVQVGSITVGGGLSPWLPVVKR